MPTTYDLFKELQAYNDRSHASLFFNVIYTLTGAEVTIFFLLQVLLQTKLYYRLVAKVNGRSYCTG